VALVTERASGTREDNDGYTRFCHCAVLPCLSVMLFSATTVDVS
jgi:hypothetical protein